MLIPFPLFLGSERTNTEEENNHRLVRQVCLPLNTSSQHSCAHRLFFILWNEHCIKPNQSAQRLILWALAKLTLQLLCYHSVGVCLSFVISVYLTSPLQEPDLAFAIADCCSLDTSKAIKLMAEKAETINVHELNLPLVSSLFPLEFGSLCWYFIMSHTRKLSNGVRIFSLQVSSDFTDRFGYIYTL